MNVLENDSCFRIRLDFSLSEMDQDVLSFLYLPFLKEDAYSLYLSFYRYNSLLKTSVYERSEEFLSLLGFDVSSFLLARRKLEGVGLLETYAKKRKTNEVEEKSPIVILFSLRQVRRSSSTMFCCVLFWRSQ